MKPSAGVDESCIPATHCVLWIRNTFTKCRKPIYIISISRFHFESTDRYVMRTALVFTCIIAFFFLLTILADKANAEDYNSVLQKACSTTPHNALCLESLGAAEQSGGGTDLAGVLCMALKQVFNNLTDTQGFAKRFLQNSNTGFVSQTVFDCTNTYDDAVSRTRQALTYCEKKSYAQVKGPLLAAMADPKICEDKFTIYPGTVSPLKSRNDVLLQLYGNALSITDSVINSKQ